MSLDNALKYLANIGVTTDVLVADRADPADLLSVRTLVEDLMRAATAESRITSEVQLTTLQAALGELYTDDELAAADAVAARIRADWDQIWPAPDQGDDWFTPPCVGDVEPALTSRG